MGWRVEKRREGLYTVGAVQKVLALLASLWRDCFHDVHIVEYKHVRPDAVRVYSKNSSIQKGMQREMQSTKMK